MQVVTSQIASFSENSFLENSAQFPNDNPIPATVNMALYATYKSNEEAIEDVCHYIINNLSDIIQLPELFFIDDKTITNNAEQLVVLNNLCEQLITRISAELRPFQYVCTSLVIDEKHQAVLISEHGVVATQQQIQFCPRYPWTTLSDELNLVEVPLEQGIIKVAMLTADDASSTALVDSAALNHIHLLLVPFDIQTPCEVQDHLLSRAAERKICIAVASREKSFPHEPPGDDSATLNKQNKKQQNNKQKSKSKQLKSTGFIADLPSSVGLSRQSDVQDINSDSQLSVSQLNVKHQQGKITKALIHPRATCT